MKKTHLATLIASALVISGCALFPADRTSMIDLNYKTENARATGVVQVFDIGSNTVVQIKGIESTRPAFLDDRNNELTYKIIGQTAVLNGIYPSFRVIANNATSKVTRSFGTQPAANNGNAVPMPPSRTSTAASTDAQISPQVLAKHKESSPAFLTAEIARMRKELAELKSLIGQVAPQVPSPSAPTTPMHEDKTLERSTVIVQFKDNSNAFEPSQVAQTTILEMAAQAESIEVRGFTDSFTPTAYAQKLAKLRALAAKDYLVSKGVTSAKISVTYQSAGGFIADNTTKEGKAANRRVEINVS